MEFLKKLSFFSEMGEEEIKAIQALAREKQLQKDDTLFNEGSPGREFYIIKEGEITIYKNVAGGKRRALANLASGTIVGEISLFDNRPYSAQAEAAAETTLLAFNIPEFNRLLQEQPALASKFYRQVILTLCSRMRQTNEKISQSVMWGFTGQR